jgi:hypothetical protein
VAGAASQAHHANQHVQLLLFARPVLTHFINSTEKNITLSAGFECAKEWCMLWNGMHFRRLLHHHQSKKTSLLWQSTHTLLKNIFNTWLAASDS